MQTPQRRSDSRKRVPGTSIVVWCTAQNDSLIDQLAGKTNDLISVAADPPRNLRAPRPTPGLLSSALKGEGTLSSATACLSKASIEPAVGGSFDNEAQQAATLALIIMEQTADAHGATHAKVTRLSPNPGSQGPL